MLPPKLKTTQISCKSCKLNDLQAYFIKNDLQMYDEAGYEGPAPVQAWHVGHFSFSLGFSFLHGSQDEHSNGDL